MKKIFGDCLQTNPRLNREEAWPASQFPDAEYRYFRDCGCLVCALTVLLRHGGMEEAATDPWVLNQRLIAAGAFTPEADLELEKIAGLYPLKYLGEVIYSKENLCCAVGKGMLCLITVSGIHAEKHFTALLTPIENEALVFDPLYGIKTLSEYDRVCEIRLFRRDP